VGGKEFVVVSLVMFMLNNRMVVAGPPYQNDKTGSVWAEVGAAAMTAGRWIRELTRASWTAPGGWESAWPG